MTSQNILKACKAKDMKPVCDHSNYNDGNCKAVGGHWHFSHPSHDRSHKVPLDKVRGAFFYCGRANHNRAMLNTGHTHKWTHDRYEQEGDTFCVKRSKDFLKNHGTFKHGDYTIQRIEVKGNMQSDNIYKACLAKGIKPFVTMPATLMADAK